MSKLIHIWKWISFAILTFVIIEEMPFAIPKYFSLTCVNGFFLISNLIVSELAMCGFKKWAPQVNIADSDNKNSIHRLGFRMFNVVWAMYIGATIFAQYCSNFGDNTLQHNNTPISVIRAWQSQY